MKRTLALILCMTALASSGTAYAEDNTVKAADIDKTAYEYMLKNPNFDFEADTDGDGIISENELKAMPKLLLDLTGVKDISWLKRMDSLNTLYLENGDFTDLSFLTEMSSLKSLILSRVPVEDISFVKDMELDEFVIQLDADYPPEKVFDIIRWKDCQVDEGYAALAGGLPEGIIDYGYGEKNDIVFKIEDTEIADILSGTSSPWRYASAQIFGKKAGTTKYTVECGGKAVHTGTITVAPTKNTYDPPLEEPKDIKVYDELSIVIGDSIYNLTENGWEKKYDDVLCRTDLRYLNLKTLATPNVDVLVFKDGKVLIEDKPVELGIGKIVYADRSFLVDEKGSAYILEKDKSGEFITFKVGDNFECPIKGTDKGYLDRSGKLVYVDRQEEKGWPTSITSPISALSDYFVDDKNILWHVEPGVKGAIVKKIAENVVSVAYIHYDNKYYGPLYTDKDGISYTLEKGTVAVPDGITSSSRTVRYCGLFIPYQKGPVSYQTAGGSDGVTYDYIISNDDVMYINNGEKKNSITNVERYINCINNEKGKTVFFMRKDNTIWQYDTYTDEFTKTDITASVTDKRGDINGDAVLDGKDLELLAQFITQPQSTVRAEDINGDGKINTFDIVALRRMIAEEK